MWNFLPWWLLRKAVDTGSSLLDGLVSYWPLDEISGVRYDAVGSNDLTDNNTVGAKLRGPEGTVADIVAANSENLSHPTLATQIDSSLGITVAMWVKWVSGVAKYFQLGGDIYQGVGSFSCNDQGAGGGYIFCVADIGDYAPKLAGANPIGTGWNLIVCTYDPTTKKVRLTQNVDQQDVLSAAVASDPVFSGTVSFVLQGGTAAGSRTGQGGPAGIWNRTITDEEMALLFADGNGLRYAELSDGLKTGLVSWWELDEVSGVRYDSHGSNDLTDNNTVGSVSSGPKGVVANLVRGNNETLSASIAPANNQAYSVAVWYKATGFLNLIDLDQYFYWYSGGNHVWGTGGGSIGGFPMSSDVLDTGWRLFVFRQDGTTAKITDNVTTYTRSVTPTTTGAKTLTLGTVPGTDYTTGNLANAAVWDRAVSDAEVLSLFNAGRGKRYADLTDGEKVGLVSYWNLDEQSGVRYDSHGSNDLTDNNTVLSVINAGDAMDGAAASFVAANSETLSKADFVSPDSYTFSAWVYAPTAIANQAIQQIIGIWPNSSQFTVYYGTTNTIYHLVGDGSSYSYSASALPGGPDLSGRWIHVIAWLDGADKIPHVSVNGTVDLVLTGAALAGTPYRVPTAFQINGASGPAYSTITADEVAIWDRVLTSDERAELFNLGRGKYYDFS